MNENRIPTRLRARGLVMGLALALLAGCQSGGTRPEAGAVTAPVGADATGTSPAGKTEDPLLARATERWQLLIAGKFAEAYDYLSPGYREVVDREEYEQTMAKRQVFWTSAVATDRDCAEEVCRVRVDIVYKVNMPVMGVGEVESYTTITENWIQGGDGRWFLVPDRAG